MTWLLATLFGVAPHAGAWIETSPLPPVDFARHSRPSRRGVDRNSRRPSSGSQNVSPLTQGRGSKPGRWRPSSDALWSPLRQGRGSKLHQRQRERRGRRVAPHAGAWIETLAATASLTGSTQSPLTQGRGSKRRRALVAGGGALSPLTQGRGSKRSPPQS